MISADEGSLICDLAETYGIFDWRSLPVRLVATLASGLGRNSRIRMKMSESEISLETMLLAMIADRLSMLWWAETEDGQNNRNRPPSILGIILDENENDTSTGFVTPEEFEKAREEIIKSVKEG